jgi:hypothetical protein
MFFVIAIVHTEFKEKTNFIKREYKRRSVRVWDCRLLRGTTTQKTHNPISIA